MTNKFDFLEKKRQQASEQAAGPVRRRGRPQGKRSDPDYEQVTAYIRRNTYHQTKLALLQEGKERQFSDLVEELLSHWLKPRASTTKPPKT